MKFNKRQLNKTIALIISFALALNIFGQPIKALKDDMTFGGFTAWTFKPSGSDTIEKGTGISGNAAMIKKGDAGVAKLTSDTVKVTPGKKYKAGVSVKMDYMNGGNTELHILAFSDAEGKHPVDTDIIVGSISEANNFVDIEGDFIVPENGLFIALKLFFGNELSVKNDLYFADNAYLFEYTSAMPIYNSYVGGQWYKLGWSSTATKYAETVEEGYLDSGALRLVNESPSGDMPIAIESSGVTPGEYTLTMYIKGHVTFPNEFKFFEQGHADALVKITDQAVYSDWTKIERDITIFADRSDLPTSPVFILFFGQYSNVSDLYVDNISLINKVTELDALSGKGSFKNKEENTLITTNNLVVNGGFEDIWYSHLPISEFNGTFEGADNGENKLDWILNDNTTGDILKVEIGETGKHLVLERGTGASIDPLAGYTAISSPLVDVNAGGKYRLGYSLQGEGIAPSAVMTYFLFDSEGAVIGGQNKPGIEGEVPATWSSYEAEIMIPASAASLQLRIISKGYEGDIIRLDNVLLNPCIEKVQEEMELLNLYDSYTGGQWYKYLWENNENRSAQIEQTGHEDEGSLHFINKGIHGDMNIAFETSGVIPGEYTLTMYIKGSITYPGEFKFYEQGHDSNIFPLTTTPEYDNWTKFEKTIYVFADRSDAPTSPVFFLAFGQYANVADLYVDNISLVNNSTSNDAFAGKGNFNSGMKAILPDIAKEYPGNNKFYMDNVNYPFTTTKYSKIVEQGNKDPGSLKIFSSGSGQGDIVTFIHPAGLQSGKTYTLSAYIRGNVGYTDAGNNIKIFEQGAAESLILTTPAKLEYGTGNIWEFVSKTVTCINPNNPYYIMFGQYCGASEFYIDNISLIDDETGIDMLGGEGDFCVKTSFIDEDINLFPNPDFEQTSTLTIPGWIITGNISYDNDSDAIKLKYGGDILSYRYNISGGEIYKYSYTGKEGKLTFIFDETHEHTASSNKGYFIVPENASNVRVRYSALGSEATVSMITLTQEENSDNFDFELKDPNEEKPLNWYGYETTIEGAYELQYGEGEGFDQSNALKISVTRNNEGSYITYSIRKEIAPLMTYNLTFQGKFKGNDIGVFPLVRQYKGNGAETQEASSYIWLNGASTTDGSEIWNTYTSSFSTASDAAYIEIRFEVRSHNVGSVFLFDNISYEEIGSADDTNFDFEKGAKGSIPLNWTTFERREKPGTTEVFEEGNFGGYNVFKAEYASADGTAAAVLEKNNTENIQLYFKSSIFMINPNTSYSLSYDVMVQNAERNKMSIFIRQYKDKSGTNVDNESEAFLWLTDADTYGSTDWKVNGGTFKTAKNCNYMQIMFVIIGEEQSTAYLDNVLFTETEEIEDVNLDFELDVGGKPVNWTSSSSDGIFDMSVDKSVFYRGRQSVRLQKSHSEINYSIIETSKTIPVNAGNEIEFVIHMRSRNAVSGNFSAIIQGLDSDGKLVQSWNGQEQTLNSTAELSDWQKYHLTYIVSRNVKQLKLVLRIEGKQADVFVDSIEFYNYTVSDNVIFAEDFKGPSSDGMFGGWEKEIISGAPVFSTNSEAAISGNSADIGRIFTELYTLRTDYIYTLNAKYRTSDSAEGRLIIEAVDWRGIPTKTVVSQELRSSGSVALIKTSFTAVSATSYKIYIEKTSGAGAVYLQNIVLNQTGEPSREVGWEGKWIVHPEDYDNILSHLHNDRYYYTRQEVNLDNDIKLAQIQISVDDKYILYVNGNLVYEDKRTGDSWNMPKLFDITEYLQKGKNIIALRIYNGVYAYGILYDGIIKMENNSSLRFYSNDDVHIAREKSGEQGIPNPAWSENDANNFMKPEYDMSSSEAWVKAAVFTKVGGGAWGLIDFDYTEYSDFKLESNTFKFPTGTLFAGDIITVEAQIKIKEKLPKTTEFNSFFWKRNTTNKICSGKINLANGITTDDWPIGKEFTAIFQLKIPEFLAEGNYTIQFDNTVAIISDYFINNKVGNIKVTQPEREVTTTSEVKMHNGRPTYFVNGIATAPIWFARPERDHQFDEKWVTKFADVGIDTVVPYVLSRETLGELWMPDGTLNTDTIDSHMLLTLAGNPESFLQIAIDTAPPQWWLEANPEECVKLSNDELSKESFSSEKWKKETGEIIVKIINYIMAQPYANNVVGFKILGGTTYEWQWWGMNGNTKDVGDFSSSGLIEYRKWLKEKYITNTALQTSWNDPEVKFETAEVPTITARSESEYKSIIHAQNSRDIIDYELFMADKKTDAIIYFADLIKKTVNNRIVVGTYAGYLLNCLSYEFATTTAQVTFDKIIEAKSIDYIICPWLYGEREMGYSADYMGPVDSVTSHGKLYVAEDDSRLNLLSLDIAQDSRASVGWTRTTKQSIETIKRNFAHALIKGHTINFYNLGGGYFDDDQYYGVISQMMQEMTLTQGLKRTNVSDIAVFIDGESQTHFPYIGPSIENELLFKSLLQFQRRELNNIGAPYNTYMLEDLEKGIIPEHKINIMLSATRISETQRAAIEEQLMKNGNIILWVFVAGISDGKTTDISLMSDITGIDLEIISTDRKPIGTVSVHNYNHWLTEGLSNVTFGANEYNTLSPVIAVKDPDVVSIGSHNKTGLIGNHVGMAVKEFSDINGKDWVSIYSAVPNIPSALIRNMLKHVDGHIFDDNTSDIVFADSNYVSIHSLFSGERTIKLPQNHLIYDVFNRKIISENTNEFSFVLKGAETLLYRLSKPNTIPIYITKTLGGNITNEGINELQPGGNLKFKFQAEDGYRVNHLLIDGQKTLVKGDSFSFNNVMESHTVVVKFAREYDKFTNEKEPNPTEPVKPTKPEPTDPIQPEEKPIKPEKKPIQPVEDGPSEEHPEEEKNESDGKVSDPDEEPNKKPVEEEKTEYFEEIVPNWPAIIALIVGVLVGLGALALLIIFVRKKKKTAQ